MLGSSGPRPELLASNSAAGSGQLHGDAFSPPCTTVGAVRGGSSTTLGTDDEPEPPASVLLLFAAPDIGQMPGRTPENDRRRRRAAPCPWAPMRGSTFHSLSVVDNRPPPGPPPAAGGRHKGRRYFGAVTEWNGTGPQPVSRRFCARADAGLRRPSYSTAKWADRPLPAPPYEEWPAPRPTALVAPLFLNRIVVSCSASLKVAASFHPTPLLATLSLPEPPGNDTVCVAPSARAANSPSVAPWPPPPGPSDWWVMHAWPRPPRRCTAAFGRMVAPVEAV